MSSQKQYLKEFVVSWRYLVATSLGLAAGYGLVNYINNIFTPQLLAQFDWTRSDIALVGIAAFMGILTQPVAGRLTDVFGVKRIARIGVICAPLVFVGFGSMTGRLWEFFLLTFLQVLIIGGTTSAVIYNRLVAQTFKNARGVAFAIAASAAPVAGAFLAPLLSMIMDIYSWREGYFAAAAFTAVTGVIALSLIPPDSQTSHTLTIARRNPEASYGHILKQRRFQIMFWGFLLCNVSFTLQTQHLKVILLDNGLDSTLASFAISLFAFSVIAGRLLCGFALDRFPAHLVAWIGLGLPGIGLAMLATGSSGLMVVAPAVLMLGISLGAESDILAYLVGKYFRLEIFSTVFGVLLGGLALSVASGSLLLSYVLAKTEAYTLFLIVSSMLVLLGSALFYRLGRFPAEADQASA